MSPPAAPEPIVPLPFGTRVTLLDGIAEIETILRRASSRRVADTGARFRRSRVTPLS